MTLKSDRQYDLLKTYNIFGRQYFLPLIGQFPTKSLPSASPENLPVADRIMRQVLCLPIYADIDADVAKKICLIIRDAAKSL